MRTYLLAVMLLVGCKGKPADDTRQAGSGSGSAAAPIATPDAAAAATSSQKDPTVVTLPKSPGTPLVKSTKPLDQPTADKLTKLDFPSFSKDVRAALPRVVEVRYKTVARPRLGATVDVSACGDCTPMDLEKWKANTDKLKAQLLPEELRNRKDTVFEVGETELAGQKMIYTYQVGHLFGKDDQGNQQGTYSDAYVLYWNDGINMIRVVAEYKDDAMPREDMLRVAPKEDLEKVAKAFVDAFAHAW